MRKIVIFCLFIVFMFRNGAVSYAQLTSLYQNFDVACVTTPYFPANWLLYNPIPTSAISGAWTCSGNNGNYNTPGVYCTGYYSGAYHIDTSYLITPMLNFSSYAGHHLYLRFDSRTSNIVAGSGLIITRSPHPDSVVVGSVANVGLNSTIYPAIGIADSLGWVTHEIDLTPSVSYGNFYLTFMYTSTAASGSVWYLDNVISDSLSMKLTVDDPANLLLPMRVVGASSRNEIDLSYSAPVAGRYQVSIIDMLGREVYSAQLNAQSGTENYTIKGLDLHSGMYCIKMGDGVYYGIAKAMIR